MQEALRFAVLIAVFGAVMLSAEAFISYSRSRRSHGRAVNERLRLIAKGASRDEVFANLRRDIAESFVLPPPFSPIQFRLQQALRGAGIRTSSSTVLLYLSAAVLFLFAVVSLFAYSAGYSLSAQRLAMIAGFAVAAGWGIPRLYISKRASARKRKLVEQFPVALDIFVRGLRAGHPIASALDLLTAEMSDPIGTEFGIAVDEVTYGADIRTALQNMADRCGIDDMHMFVVSLSVQSETGGNLAEILEGLSSVIRERASMFMKVRALSSEGRMTAIMLTVLPIAAFVGLFVLNPKFYLDVADDPAFLPGFGGLILMFFIGIMIIRRLVDLKV